MAKNNEILKAALKYADKGWAVFPVSKDKNPLVKNGFKDATTDKETIKKWFSYYTGANIGIATGQVSGGLIVIDVDIDENEGKFGDESLEAWLDENDCYFPDTLTATTGRGGKHYYFHSSVPFGCKVGAIENVDIRGDGGYVVVPPSIHKNGMYYKWDDEDEEIASVDHEPDVQFFLYESFKNTVSDKDKFEIPKEAGKGSRNDTLFKIAASFQSQGMDNESIFASVKAYNLANCKPPLSDEEVNKIIKSVVNRYEKGTKQVEVPKDLGKTKASTKRKLKKGSELMQKEIPEPIVYVGIGREDPILVEGTCILSAKPKLGKSWFVLGMCLAICNGEDFLGYKTKKCSCLYLDLETSESIQKKRLIKASAGEPIPDNFYLDTETDNLENGFVDQINNYLEQDPDIGVVVVDVFQIIRSRQDAKNKENEYQHAYRDITPLNNLAMEKHISIILVCHDRKMVDENDPFSNILGSTGLQGAVSQMIVMFQKTKDDPITVAIKGKTIDAQPIIYTKLSEGQWELTSNDSAEMASIRKREEFFKSDIRIGIVKIAEEGDFKGTCTEIIFKSASIYPILADAQKVGGFLNKFAPYLKEYDQVLVDKILNGTGSKIYKLHKISIKGIDSIDEGIDVSIRKQGFTGII
jgi:hypothetical protein